MTEFINLSFQGTSAFVLCRRDDGELFYLNCALQCSGAMLVESRQSTGLMSKYVNHVLRDGFLDDRMYGSDNRFYLDEDEEAMVYDMWVHLRKTCEWDNKYSPGAGFTGHDITPIDGLGDFK